MSDSPSKAEPKSENVAAVLKVFAVIEALVEDKKMGLADLAQRAMTSKTTAHRLLQTMVELGYVEQDPETEKYGLTLKLFSLGARSLTEQTELLRVADQAMGKLSRATGESINLGILDDRDQRVVYIHKYDSAYNLSMKSTLGLRNPLHSTSLGKALLAWRDDDEIRERLSKTELTKRAPRTITDLETLIDVLHAEGFHVLALHGELDQRDRDQVMVQFANRSCSVLVATDVAARGLDIAKLEAVINVDVTPDPEVHIHRIGRTGRADAAGWALSLVGPNELNRVNAIARSNGFEPQWESIDELQSEVQTPLVPPMVTLQILGGRKEKIRPGDVLGALTGEAGFAASQIGKINVNEQSTYVAVERSIARQALKRLSDGKIKGKKVRVFLLDE